MTVIAAAHQGGFFPPVHSTDSFLEAELPRINIIDPSGKDQVVETTDGMSVMKAAITSMVPGIIGECGGDLSCATCHVFVDQEWVGKLAPASPDEEDMLEATSEETTDCSRLSCQIIMSEELDGLIVRTPVTQR